MTQGGSGSRGDGHFGRWIEDAGLPAYRYECDPDTDPAYIDPQVWEPRPRTRRTRPLSGR